MKKLWKVVRILLEIWGGLSLIGVIALGVLIAVTMARWTGAVGDKNDFAGPEDVMFILNWGDIGDKAKVVQVLHSHQSPRSFTGDHCDAYCIEIDRFPDEVVKPDKWGRERWLVGPVANPILKDAIDNACGWPESYELDWFPSAEEMNSGRFYLSFWSISAHNQMVDQVQMIAWDREKKLLYFSDISW